MTKLLARIFDRFGVYYDYRNRKEYYNKGDSLTYRVEYYHWNNYAGHSVTIEIGLRRWEWEWGK